MRSVELCLGRGLKTCYKPVAYTFLTSGEIWWVFFVSVCVGANVDVTVSRWSLFLCFKRVIKRLRSYKRWRVRFRWKKKMIDKLQLSSVSFFWKGYDRWFVHSLFLECWSIKMVSTSVFFGNRRCSLSEFLFRNCRCSLKIPFQQLSPFLFSLGECHSLCDVNSSCWISLRTRLYRHFPFSQTCAWRMRDTRPLPLMAAMACDVIVFVNSLAPRTCVMRRWWAGWGFNEKFSSPSLQRYNERLRSGDAESWKMRGWEEVCGSELTFGSIRQVQTSPRLSAP